LIESVICIPTAYRPEMLALCLERLRALKNLPPVHIFLDHVGERLLAETTYVRDTYLPEASLTYHPEHIKAESGCWNILHSMKAGYDLGAEFVFLLEDDVQVYPRWLDWSLGEMRTGQWMATCGRRIPLFFQKHNDIYTNPGSCLRRDLLAALVPHIRDEYFHHPRGTAGYIREVLGREPVNSSLDDGMVRTVMAILGGKCKYPDKPVCAHQGLDWYQNLDIYMNPGTIAERIVGLKRIHEKIRTDKRYERYSQDFEPYNPLKL
jgi:hypothetical protein